jgi:hypothetical protein
MLKLKFFVVLFVTMALVVGCGPIYKRQYDYVAPKSSVGKMCTAQCQMAKSACEQSCELRNQTCVNQARQEAIYSFESYKQQMSREGKPIVKSLGDFDYSNTCRTTCDCLHPYQACYSACGGKVIEKKVCVAFCDKQ